MALKKYSFRQIAEIEANRSPAASQETQENRGINNTSSFHQQVYDNPSFEEDEEVSPETAERVVENFVNRPVPLSQHPFGGNNPYKDALYGEIERSRRNGLDHGRVLVWFGFLTGIILFCVIVIALAEYSPDQQMARAGIKTSAANGTRTS